MNKKELKQFLEILKDVDSVFTYDEKNGDVKCLENYLFAQWHAEMNELTELTNFNFIELVDIIKKF